MGPLSRHESTKRDGHEQESAGHVSRQADEECWELYDLPVLDYEPSTAELGQMVQDRQDGASTGSLGPDTPEDERGSDLFDEVLKDDDYPSFDLGLLGLDSRVRGSAVRDDLAISDAPPIGSEGYIKGDRVDLKRTVNQAMTPERAGKPTAKSCKRNTESARQRQETGFKTSTEAIGGKGLPSFPHSSLPSHSCCGLVECAKQHEECGDQRATRTSPLWGSEFSMSSLAQPPRSSTIFSSLLSIPFLKARARRVFRRRSGQRNSSNPGGIALDDAEKGRWRGTARVSSVRRLTWVFTIMLGAVLCLVLAFGVWHFGELWESHTAPGRSSGDMWTGESQNHTALPVKRRWLHSHNDEMHGAEALLLALRLGYGSVEVDTWLGPSPLLPSAVSLSATSGEKRALLGDASGSVAGRGSSDDTLVHMPDARGMEHESFAPRRTLHIVPDTTMTLLTGHKAKDVSGRTLAESYLDPLFARLEENNKGRLANETVVGVYKDDPTAEVQLVIDMKSDGDATWLYLVSALQRFVDRGYLTTYDADTSGWSRSALMVIGTGNTPIHRVYHQTPRIVFYDAPLKQLSRTVSIPRSDAGPATHFEWDRTIAPMASDKFPIAYHLALALPPWNDYATRRLRGYTREAARRGIEARWWGSARKPGWVRRRLWEIQKEGGVVWTNADDLADAADWLTEYEGR